MSTLSKAVFAVCNLATRNVWRNGFIFSYQSCMPRDKHTYTGVPGPDELFFEDSLEESVNDPQSELPSKIPGKQSIKKQMELQQRKDLKKKIIRYRMKRIQTEKQASLLTWAAIAQIKHLNNIDPIYWTPEMLSKSFPAPFHEIIKILKCKRLPLDEKEIYKHDKVVYRNWLKLSKVKKNLMEGGPIDPEFRTIAESGKLELMQNAAGSHQLPIPDTKSMLLTQREIAERRRPKIKGMFSAILEDYKKDVVTIKEEAEIRHIQFKDQKVLKLLKNISIDDKTHYKVKPAAMKLVGNSAELENYQEDEVSNYNEMIMESNDIGTHDRKELENYQEDEVSNYNEMRIKSDSIGTHDTDRRYHSYGETLEEYKPDLRIKTRESRYKPDLRNEIKAVIDGHPRKIKKRY